LIWASCKWYLTFRRSTDKIFEALICNTKTRPKKKRINVLGKKTGTQNIVKEIKQHQEEWLQHIQRMDTNRIPKQALQYQPKDKGT